VRTAVDTAAREAALMNRKLRLDQERGVYDDFVKKGVTIVQPNREEFAAKLRPVQDAVKPELQPLLQRIRAA
jgi:TRAP-type C4-dicarboxylate transport system substrate-binding protein